MNTSGMVFILVESRVLNEYTELDIVIPFGERVGFSRFEVRSIFDHEISNTEGRKADLRPVR